MSSSASSSSSDSKQSTPSPQRSGKRQHPSDNEAENSSEDQNVSDGFDSSNDSPSDAEEVEEVVLSHAEKRRQKKKAERTAKDMDPISDTPSRKGKEKMKNTAEPPPSKLPKRQNPIWVGNLSFKTTAESLRTFFEGAGEITRIHMPMKMVQSGPEVKGPRKENRGSVLISSVQPCIRCTQYIGCFFPVLHTWTLLRWTRKPWP